MSLEPKDIELIERIIYKNTDDVAVSISRCFERLEDRIDASETRLSGRLMDVEDKIEGSRQDMDDVVGDLKEEVRDLARIKEFA